MTTTYNVQYWFGGQWNTAATFTGDATKLSWDSAYLDAVLEECDLAKLYPLTRILTAH